MRDNPFKAAILAVIRNTPTGLSEYDLIEQIAQQTDGFALDGDRTSLTLFRKHFLTMNALYQLQAELFADGGYLSISPLAIRLEPLRDLGLTTLPAGGSEAVLRDYYLDWNHFDNTDQTEVAAMLTRFWEKYLAIDKRLEALGTLELPADAEWLAVKRAYRRLAAIHHPDKGGDAERFRSIREAYEILSHCYAP